MEKLTNPHEAEVELSDEELDQIHGGYPGLSADGGACTRGMSADPSLPGV
ncbi:hypothetical protein [Nonomuraea sp. NPDC002799]